jgi:hypothetical protein
MLIIRYYSVEMKKNCSFLQKKFAGKKILFTFAPLL